MIKNSVILVFLILVTTTAYGQRYATQYEGNPAFNTFLQGDEKISEVSASSLLSFIGYEGAPRYNILSGNFGINKYDNIAFSFEVSQYKLADFSTTSIGLGYVYRLPSTNWSGGLNIYSDWSKFDMSKIVTYDYIDQSTLGEPIPGLGANAGIFYGGEQFKFSLAGRRVILGTKDIAALDKSLINRVLIDFGYKFLNTDAIGLGVNVGADITDFNILKSSKTLPLHFDLNVDIMESMRVMLRSDYIEGMTLGISQQTKRFIWFINQKIPFLTFGDGPSGSIMTTEIGFGIRFSREKSGNPLPHLNKENNSNEESVEEGGNDEE